MDGISGLESLRPWLQNIEVTDDIISSHVMWWLLIRVELWEHK